MTSAVINIPALDEEGRAALVTALKEAGITHVSIHMPAQGIVPALYPLADERVRQVVECIAAGGPGGTPRVSVIENLMLSDLADTTANVYISRVTSMGLITKVGGLLTLTQKGREYLGDGPSDGD